MPINTRPHIHEMVICANMFVRKNGKYLLLKRSAKKHFAPNFVHPVGGKVDPGENPYVAAERELMEEAGIRVKNIRLEGVFTEHTGAMPRYKEVPNWLIFQFSGDYESGTVKETDEGQLLWFAPQEIKKQKLIPSVAAAIDHILNPKDGTVFATFAYNKKGALVAKKTKIDICKV